jgi:hypothetical protein
MRVNLARLAVPALALLLTGADDPTRFATPPTPPKFRPPAEGVLFADDFSRDLSRWESDSSEAWTAWRGLLRANLPDRKQARSFLYAGSEEWRDYALDFDVCGMRGVDKGAVIRVQNTSGFAIDLRGGTYQDLIAHIRQWPVGKARVTNANGTWSHVRMEARGDRFRVFVNGDLLIERVDARRPAGRIAFAAYTGGVGKCTVYYDNVVVTALE